MDRGYSCDSAAQTLEWIHAIVDFLKSYSFLSNAHVVNFFKEKLWEALDKDWIECLRHEPVQNLLLIPSGVVQSHWPASLQEFVSTAKSLAFSHKQADLEKIFPGVKITKLGPVLAQGMNVKKQHEVEVLSAVVNSVANTVEAQTIVDVGAGQYELSVIAIDASAHHGKVTDARASRIRKYYAAQIRKHQLSKRKLCVPKTVICRVLSADTLNILSCPHPDSNENATPTGRGLTIVEETKVHQCDTKAAVSFVLTGLHACGDLSVTMLKSFSECEDIKAVVSLGCCYNLVTEEIPFNTGSPSGFPMSNAVKGARVGLGKNSRDLACQSADRWRSLGDEAGICNFELHAFRAAFQMVLHKFYPEISTTSPSIGRQGKSLRRLHLRRSLESPLDQEDSEYVSCNGKQAEMTARVSKEVLEGHDMCTDQNSAYRESSIVQAIGDVSIPVNQWTLFEEYCRSGLSRIGLGPLPDMDFFGLWNEINPYIGLVGPYWSLRAALGPVLETLLLLDRLLYIQEQGTHVEAFILPIFDPVLSPRNVAIIARKL